MKKLSLSTSILLTLLLITACIAPVENRPTADNAQAEPISVAIGVGAPNTPVYLNFDIARSLGYFADEGLDVDLQYFDGGSDAAAALKRGHVDFSGNALDHALEAQIDGQELRMLMNFLDHPCATLIVRSELAEEIQTPADLRGRAVGVTRLGSATHTLTVFAAANANVSANDFEVVEVGAATMPESLRAGTVDIAMGVAPYTTQLVDSGEATVLIDLCQPDEAKAALGGGFPFTGLLTRDDVIRDQPEVVQRVVNALVRAQLFITSHSAQEIAAALPSTVTGKDVKSYAEVLKATLPAFSLTGGRVDETGLGPFLRLHTVFGTVAAADDVDASSLFENRFVDVALTNLPESVEQRQGASVAEDVQTVFAAYATALAEPWNQAIHAALTAAQQRGEIAYFYEDEVGYGPAMENTLHTQIAKLTPDIVVGDAFGNETTVWQLAQEYPEIAFVFGSDEEPSAPNISVFDSWLHEPAYLGGMLAGGMTESNIVGIVAGYPEASVNGVINAFISGAEAVNPTVEVRTVFIDSWYNLEAAANATDFLVGEGADVIFGERAGAVAAAAEHSVYAIGHMVDQHSIAPDYVLSSILWEMSPAIDAVISQVREGTYSAQSLRDYGSLSAGGALLAPLNRDVVGGIPEALQTQIESTRNEIVDGLLEIPLNSEEPPAAVNLITLGALFNLTGSQAQLDRPSMQGARLAVDEINRTGGILDRPLQLVVADGESDLDLLAEKTANLLTENPDLAAVIGLSDTDMVLAAAPPAANNDTLFLTSGATSPLLPEAVPKYLYLVAFGDNVQAAAAAEWAYDELSARTATVLYNDSMLYTTGLQAYFATHFKDLGGEVVSSIGYTPGDATMLLEAVESLSEADVIFVAAGPEDAPEVVRLLRESGRTAPIIGGDGFDLGELWQQYNALDNIYFTTHAYLGADNPNAAIQHFRSTYLTHYPQAMPDAFAALGYDAVHLLATALESSEQLETAALLDALATMKAFEGVTGHISYEPGSQIPLKSVTIIAIEQGGYRYITQRTPESAPDAILPE